MKNVRLFAVAAAMGMFASTVSAASTTKYDVKWDSAQGNAIKVDLNDTIVAPVVNATATATVVSNEGTATEVCTTVEGYKGVDHNLDGREDTMFYTLNRTARGVNPFIFYTDLKYTGTAETMKYYVGLGTDGSFGRIIAPGAAAVDGFIDGAKHKLYSTPEELEALYNIFVNNEAVEVVENAEGAVTYIIDDGDSKGTTYKNSNDYLVKSFYVADNTAPVDKGGIGPITLDGATIMYGDEIRVVMNGASAGTVKAYHVSRATSVVTPLTNISTLDLGTGYTYAGVVTGTVAADSFIVAGAPDTYTTSYKESSSFVAISDAEARNVTVANENAKSAFMDYASGLITEETGDDGLVKTASYAMFNTNALDMVQGASYVESTGLELKDMSSKTGAAYTYAQNYGVFDEDGNGLTSTTLSRTAMGSFNYYTIGRKGSLVPHTFVATPSDLAPLWDGITLGSSLDTKLRSSKVILVLDEVITSGESLVDHFESALPLKNEFANTRAYDYVWNPDTEQFDKQVRAWLTLSNLDENSLSAGDANGLINQFGGFYRTKTTANTTDKYVIDMTMGAYPENYFNWKTEAYATVSTAREKITFEYLPSSLLMSASAAKPLVLDYIDIGSKRDDYWVVATDTIEEAQKLLVSLSGIMVADQWLVDALEPYSNAIASLNKSSKEITYEDYTKVVDGDWAYSIGNLQYDPNYAGAGVTGLGEYGSFKVVAADRTYADGSKKAYVPTNTLDHYSAQLCVYQGETTTPEVVVTNNVAEIDTTTAGVKTLTYTAKVGETVVDTFDMTVVVAPKYVRTWEGGKVKTLTSFYLDGTTKYAFYDYNWSAKTVTITYYNTDGSVSTTVTNAL